MNRKLIFILVAIVLFVLGPIYYGLFSITPKKEVKAKFRVLEQQPPIHEPGKVKMIIFFDFTPSCYEFESVVSSLKSKFGDKLEVNFLGYPSTPRSYLPIEAYELSKIFKKQDKMRKEMYMAMMEGRDLSDITVLFNISRKIGMDEIFEEMLNTTKFERTKYNIEFASSYGEISLPFVVFNGQIVPEELTEENLEATIAYLLSH